MKHGLGMVVKLLGLAEAVSASGIQHNITKKRPMETNHVNHAIDILYPKTFYMIFPSV